MSHWSSKYSDFCQIAFYQRQKPEYFADSNFIWQKGVIYARDRVSGTIKVKILINMANFKNFLPFSAKLINFYQRRGGQIFVKYSPVGLGSRKKQMKKRNWTFSWYTSTIYFQVSCQLHRTHWSRGHQAHSWMILAWKGALRLLAEYAHYLTNNNNIEKALYTYVHNIKLDWAKYSDFRLC